MGWWGVGLALMLPWLAGALWVRSGWRDDPAGIWPMALGYGYLLGMLVVTLLLRLQEALGLPPSFAGPAVVMAILTILGAWRLWRRVALDRLRLQDAGTFGVELSWQRIVFVLLLVWLGWRFATLAQELWLRPLFPWDAWTTWTVRPRVWAELRQWVPFVDPIRWLGDASGSLYTIDAVNYPITVPLLALWPTLAFGVWNDTAANLPWLGAALALGLGFYGQTRSWGATPLAALIFTWLLLSLPILDTHVALAGYADLWLAAFYSLAVIAFFQWLRTGDRRQAGLALLLALVCPSIKLEGMVWVLMFIPALAVAWLRGKALWALVGIVAVLGLVWILSGGVAFVAPGLGEIQLRPDLIQLPWLGRFALHYRSSWEPLFTNGFVLVNWHLLWYLALAAWVVAVPRIRVERWRRIMALFIGCCLLMLFVLFFLTDAQRWAEQYTSINRVFMHFVPALLFWMMAVWVKPVDYDRAEPTSANTCR